MIDLLADNSPEIERKMRSLIVLDLGYDFSDYRYRHFSKVYESYEEYKEAYIEEQLQEINGIVRGILNFDERVANDEKDVRVKQIEGYWVRVDHPLNNLFKRA